MSNHTRWNEKELGSLAKERGDFVDGPFGSDLKASEYIDSGVPILRLQNVKQNHFESSNIKFISHSKAKALERHNYQPGDVVITKLGDPCGVACQVPQDAESGIVVADVLRFRSSNNSVDHRYLVHFLNSSDARNQVSRLSKGTTRQRVNLSDFKKIKIPIPPLEEQKRIAAILDKADRVRRKRQEAIQLTEELGRSIFLDMFGDPVTNSKGWETCKISKIASVHRGKFTPRPRNDPRFYNGKYPFIQTGDITSAKGYLTKYKQTLNEDGIKVSRSFNPGSIVIAIVGATIGETAILKSEMYCPDSVIGITPYDLRSSEYIEYSLRYWKQIFRDQAPQTARANINLETIRPLKIPCPPIELQEKFKFVYEWSFKNINRSVHQESENLFNSLLQRAFRGEL